MRTSSSGAEGWSSNSQAELLRLHAFIPSSRANGPGDRAVIWVQGCSLACPGCFNPETHPAAEGEAIAVDALFRRIMSISHRLEGVTLSGGEPLQQFRPVLALLRRLRAHTRLSSLVFTGYTWNEIQRMPLAGALSETIDVLIAGRYDQTRRLASGLLGSTNKTVHFFSRRYTMEDLEGVPVGEVIVSPYGDVVVTGIDPPVISFY